MKSVRMVVLARTMLLLVLVLMALGFSVAVAMDQDDGTLLDPSGVITPAIVDGKTVH